MPNFDLLHRKNTDKMGRRGFTKTLLAAGFGTTAISAITQQDVAAAASDQVPIPVTLAGDETTLVPKDWYEEYTHAKRVHERNDFKGRGRDVVGQWLVPGDRGGDNSYILVEYDPKRNERGRDTVPERKDGVRVELREAGEINYHHNDGCNTIKWGDGVPGNVKCATKDYSGTMGPRMRHKSDPYNGGYFVTANHLLSGCSDADYIGKKLWQPDQVGDPIGEVIYHSNKMDLLVCKPLNGFYPRDSLVKSHTNVLIPCGGSFSESYLSDMKARNEPVYKHGWGSCDSQGQIKAVSGSQLVYEYDSCVREHRGILGWGTNSDSADGDSGGVVYGKSSNYENSGEVNIASNIIGSDPINDHSFGTAIHHMYDKTGYYFT